MKAVFFDKTLRIREYSRPNPKQNEAIVQVIAAGICNTDLEIVRGYKKHTGILGHEFVGMLIEKAGDLSGGQRVVAEINSGCGSCDYCIQGLSRHCPFRTALGISEYYGAMAEYVSLPVANLHPVPDEVEDGEAVFVEPLAAACEILEQIHIEPKDRVIVIGDGKLGILVFQVMQLTGCDPILIGNHVDRLDLLNLVPGEFVLSSIAKDELPMHSYDVVVEATGNPEGLPLALHFVKPRGTIVLKSTFADTVTLDMAEIVVNEISLIGSRCGPFPAALRLLKRKLVSVKKLIAAHYDLAQAAEAFEYARQSGVLKVLLWPGGVPEKKPTIV